VGISTKIRSRKILQRFYCTRKQRQLQTWWPTPSAKCNFMPLLWGSPHSTPFRRKLVRMVSRDVWLIAFQLSVTGNTSENCKESNGFISIVQFMPRRLHSWHYVGEDHSWSVLRIKICIQKYWVASIQPEFLNSPQFRTHWEGAETVEHAQEDMKNPCCWDKSIINLMYLTVWNI
jgi:hypothetical protein